MKRVKIADLKAHLSAHLREVRRGRSIVVLDRDTPVARIVPFGHPAQLGVRRAVHPLGQAVSRLELQRPSVRTDSLATLLADRASR